MKKEKRIKKKEKKEEEEEEEETIQYMGAGPFHATCIINIPPTRPE